MLRIQATEHFERWLDGLKNLWGRARIQARIQRLADGNPGATRQLRFGVFEVKVDVGPGYRVYFTMRRRELMILLCGGDKSSQAADIRLAYRLVKSLDV